MKRSKITQKDILFLSISMFVVVVAWIGFSIYHSVVTTTISEDLQMQIVPIDPTFDTTTIEKLKSREQVVPLLDAPITPQASTPATIQPTETVEETQTLEETILEEEPTPIQSELTPTESEPTPTI